MAYFWKSQNISKLRYYATFKVRKFESFYKINFLQKLPLAFDCRHRKYLQIFNISFFFLISGLAFAIPFLCYLQTLQLVVVNKNWNNFCCITLKFVWPQKVSQIFKILFQTGDINIFFLRGVLFSKYVLLNSSFSDEKKYQRWNLRHTLVEKLSKINVAKY